MLKIIAQKNKMIALKISDINALNKKISEEITNLKKDINELDHFNEKCYKNIRT
ncbi:MAG: hypothetical protein L6U99_01230 [Clostridium sp.]|nr:MAG: hypothetical protein L6U99_01230 [Clostridium sp.]